MEAENRAVCGEWAFATQQVSNFNYARGVNSGDSLHNIAYRGKYCTVHLKICTM